MSYSGGEYRRISAAGSATLHTGAAILDRVTVQVSTGTVTLYDNASGTSSDIVLETPTVTAPVTLSLEAQLKNGLYYVATGTPVVTVTIK